MSGMGGTSSLRVSGGRPLRGRLRVPGDKSISHRALILGALAEGTSAVRGLSPGADVARTRAAVAALGAALDGDRIAGERITGGRRRLREPAGVIDVGNSGTTIRLLAGVCASVPGLAVLAGDESVARRPMDRVAEPLRRMGAAVDGREGGRLPPLVVRGGPLAGIDHTLPVASAQVKGAVLLAGLAAAGDTVVREPLPSRAHTEEMLAACGADVSVEEAVGGGRVVRVGPSKLEPFELEVPGDPSQAAFWVVAACLVPGSDLIVEGLYLGPGRDAFLGVLERMGADLEVDRARGSVRARAVAGLRGTEIGGAEVPGLIDELPALAVAAAMAEGATVVRDAAELRVKESDRVATVAAEMRAMGAAVVPTADGFVVEGRPGCLRGAVVSSHGDHRLAMALAVAGMAASGDTVVEGFEAVATSYPGFAEDLRACAS